MLEVTWHINLHLAHEDLYHASKILTGLSVLRRKGELSLRCTPNIICPEIPRGLVLLTVRRGDKCPERKVIIDLSDTSEFYSLAALNFADIYFKRSLRREPLELLPIHLRKRVRAFGLNFPCADAGTWTDWLAASVVRARMAAKSGFAAAMDRFIDDLHLFEGIPSHSRFMANPQGHKRPIVLFQTRVWPPEESSDDLEQINRERIDLVMALRCALGERFVGGIVASEFARARCPDAVVSESTHRRAYAALTRSAMVGVYSRGIHGSVAFKLSEYLAAGCCIVAEPFECVLDVPLENGVHYLTFDSADSCVAACKRLLDDKALAVEMSRRNEEYFLRYLLPEPHIARLLETATSGL